MVSSAEDERTASRVAVERAAEALGADLAVLLQDGEVVASVGFTRDPVLEAVPATPELGKDMWDRVDSITQSLDALGALDLVTTERLLGLFAGKLRAIPIR